MHEPHIDKLLSAEKIAPTFEIWDAARAEDRKQWVHCWTNWPAREVFAHPAFLELFATGGERVLCAHFESPAGKVIYPFHLRDLAGQPYVHAADGPATDLNVPFSYGGPVCSRVADRATLAAEFWRAFDNWADCVGLVSEYVRLSLFEETLIDSSQDREFRQQNVVRSLDLSEEELWSDVRHKVRKNVKRARQNNVQIELDLTGVRLDDFLAIYWGTMDRREVGASFHLERGFFEQICRELPGQFAFFHALHQGRVVSSELVLVSEENLYSCLGGSQHDAFNLRPNDLLKYEVMRWGMQAGKRRFVLGGGAAPGDGIFHYKQAFAPHGVFDFYLRKRIVDRERYDLLCGRVGHVGTDADVSFFPAYRLGDSARQTATQAA